MAKIDKRINSKGEISYRVRIRLKGHPLISATFNRKTDAERWAQKTEVEMRAGRYIKTPESKKRTLQDLIEKYEQTLLPKRKGDRKIVGSQLLWWKEQLGPYLLADITPQMIAECRDKLAEEPIQMAHEKKQNNQKPSKKPPKFRSAATIIRYCASLSVCFSLAIDELGWMESNPVQKVKKPSLDNDRTRFLSDEESKELLAACKSSTYNQLYTIVVIALATGARKNEIMTLKWNNIDLNKSTMHLDKTKNGEKRTIPLSPIAMKCILELRKVRRTDTQFLFPRRDGLNPFSIKKHWEKAVSNARLDDFHFHDLRHTTASRLAMSGANLLDIAHVLGHKQLKMVKRYAHLTEQHTATVLDRMNELQFAQIDTKASSSQTS